MIEEIRDVEDKFELGQNEIQKVKIDLNQTKDVLTSTQNKLEAAKSKIEQLEKEKQSIRRLSKDAVKLLGRRVGNIIPFRRKRRAKGQGHPHVSEVKKANLQQVCY